ncbi:MAG TPA: metallophosphoesterase [Candidatus Limnocylindria bacterium]|nr:metallophosphoesterase [Candidatus Limnocylindria bacterium]
MRLAAMGDIHCTRDSHGELAETFAAAGEAADLLVLCGDLTDYGLPAEAEVLGQELASAKVPVVGVLGNHDHESGEAGEVARILADAGVRLLDGDAVEIDGVGFAGTKGFGGGFGRHALGSWGEPAIKAFVQEAVDEALKLENALARLRTDLRVAVLHYAPIRDTVENEPPEIFPWLGSERLEEPIDRFELTLALHGHAHHGAPEGRTRGGVPVYNVSAPLLRGLDEQRPFRVIELPAQPAAAGPRVAASALDRQSQGL